MVRSRGRMLDWSLHQWAQRPTAQVARTKPLSAPGASNPSSIPFLPLRLCSMLRRRRVEHPSDVPADDGEEECLWPGFALPNRSGVPPTLGSGIPSSTGGIPLNTAQIQKSKTRRLYNRLGAVYRSVRVVYWSVSVVYRWICLYFRCFFVAHPR
jgi:hypothetical protein